MKKGIVFILSVLLVISLGLNVMLCIKYIFPNTDIPKANIGISLSKNKYEGTWKADGYFLTDLFVESDGSVMLAWVQNKKATEEDPYSAFIKAIYKGHIEDNVILIDKKFVSEYDTIQKIEIREEGSPEPKPIVIYHDSDDITDDLLEDVVMVYTIEDISENAIKIMLSSGNTLNIMATTFIRQ